jgi:hypothetical protein
MGAGGDVSIRLVGRLPGRDEQDPLEAERLGRFLGDGEMGEMDRVERATEHSE